MVHANPPSRPMHPGKRPHLELARPAAERRVDGGRGGRGEPGNGSDAVAAGAASVMRWLQEQYHQGPACAPRERQRYCDVDHLGRVQGRVPREELVALAHCAHGGMCWGWAARWVKHHPLRHGCRQLDHALTVSFSSAIAHTLWAHSPCDPWPKDGSSAREPALHTPTRACASTRTLTRDAGGVLAGILDHGHGGPAVHHKNLQQVGRRSRTSRLHCDVHTVDDLDGLTRHQVDGRKGGP